MTSTRRSNSRANLKAILIITVLLSQVLTTCLADTAYPNTVQALQERFHDEIEAHVSYAEFSKKALQEGYPNSAYLFKSLAASEAVHARNFRRILGELDSQVPSKKPPQREVGNTRSNIMNATGVEANEIDHKYPDLLEHIKAENHKTAINNLTWAWKSEEQHRKLLGRMQDAAKSWFGFLIAHIEGEVVDYHVCEICGSTLTEKPSEQCPICKHPASHYRKIPYVAAERAEPEDY